MLIILGIAFWSIVFLVVTTVIEWYPVFKEDMDRVQREKKLNDTTTNRK